MNDCVWFSLGVCDSSCRCNKYISINSDEGNALMNEYEKRVQEVLEPLVNEFITKYGFYGKWEPLKITQLGFKKQGMQVPKHGGFVRAEHKESGIAVTKYNKYQYKARVEAEEELGMLVRIWGEE